MSLKEQTIHLQGRIGFWEHTFGGIKTKNEWMIMNDDMFCVFLSILLFLLHPLYLVDLLASQSGLWLWFLPKIVYHQSQSWKKTYTTESLEDNLFEHVKLWKLNSPDLSFLPLSSMVLHLWTTKNHRGHRCLRWQPWEQRGERSGFTDSMLGWKFLGIFAYITITYGITYVYK